VIAQDYLTDTVGRVLAFDGTRVLQSANDTLRDVIERLGARRVARHARVALGVALSEDHKVLALGDTVQAQQRPASALAGAHIACARADVSRAQADLTAALTDDTSVAAETLGHIDFTYYVDRLVDLLAREGERGRATQVLGEVMKTLSARGVLKRVIDRIESRLARMAVANPAR
jgi:hypothetical protein